MLYDKRMYPQALEHQGMLYLVWRAKNGFPFIRSYDLESRRFSEAVNLLKGMEDRIDAPKYKRDHHYAPIVWNDTAGYLHVLFGCHGNSGGVHLVSKHPRSIAEWRQASEIAQASPTPRRTVYTTIGP